MSLNHIHPMLVHFPIAFTYLSIILFLYGIIKKRDDALLWGRIIYYLGGLSSLPAFIAGKIAESAFEGGSEKVESLIENHQSFGLVTMLSFFGSILIGLALYKKFHSEKWYPVMHLIFAIFMALLVSVTAYIGGLLVYIHGVGITTVHE